LDELWRHAPDAKALSALYLYERYLHKEPNASILPIDEQMEKNLLEKVKCRTVTPQ